MAELALVNVVDNARSKKANHASDRSKTALFTAGKSYTILSDENIKKLQEMESRHCSSDEFPILWDGEE